MANTVSILGYANTFGEWVVTTNALVKENNDLAANTYIKPTGTLFLNDSSLGLQVATRAIVGGQLQVQGVGSSAYVQNNMNVGSQVYLTNTQVGLVNFGDAHVEGIFYANGSSGVLVSNNVVIGTSLYVGGNANINMNLAVTSNIAGNNATIANNIITNTVQANTKVNTSTLSVTGNTYSNNVIANSSIYVPTIVGNTNITGNLIVNYNVTSNNLQANIAVNTSILSVTGNTYTNIVIANTAMYAPSVNVSSALNANNASGSFKELYVDDQMTVNGNFVLTGTTVYDSNKFTINAGSNIGINSFFSVNRGNSGANAAIRWNESGGQYWDLLDVTNSTYYRILTTELINDTLISTSTSTVASANSINALNTLVNTGANSLQSQLTANVISLQNQISGNSNSLQTQLTNNIANVYTALTANVNNLQTQISSNVSTLQTQISSNVISLQGQITSNVNYITGVDNTQNTNITLSINNAASASAYANTGIRNAASASAYANAGITLAQAAFNATNSSSLYANTGINNAASASLYANTGINNAASASQYANTGINNAASASQYANNGIALAQASYNKANASIIISNDNSTNETAYPLFSTASSGSIGTAYTSSGKLTYNPSNGVLSTTQFSATSDEVLKENIQTITNALDMVRSLRGVSFDWKENGKPSFGLIAQELEKLLPQLVNISEDGIKSVFYNGIIAFLIEAIKQLADEVQELKTK